MTYGTAAEIDGFYPPLNHWDTNGFLYANSVYDPLMAVAADGTVKPYLCQSLTPNAAMDTWTMTLRPGIKFNDGSPLTSAVVLANYNELKTSPLTGVVFERVKGVTAPDAMTVVYSLDDSYPAFPAAFTSQIGYPFGLAMIDQVKSELERHHRARSGPARSSTPTGSRTTTSPSPATRTTGSPSTPTSTRSPSSPSPTPPSASQPCAPAAVDIILSLDPNTINRFAAPADPASSRSTAGPASSGSRRWGS